MIEGLEPLQQFTGAEGYISSSAKEAGGDYLAKGSENATLSGTGKINVHKGNTKRATVKGGFVMQNIAETFASIGQTSDGTAYGNVMNVFAALFYIGKGLVRLAGTSLLVNASATLSLLIKRDGSYVTDPESGPWQAGLAAPSAPIITAVAPPAGFTGKVTGTVSVVIWRIRSTTGAVSNQSPVSNIVEANNQSIAIQFPLTDANGQDAWGVGVTKQIEGRVGSHFELTEILESEITDSITRTDVVTDSSDLDITSATGGLTSSHIGWTVTLSGGSPACVLSTYVTAVPDGNTLTLQAMPPTTSTGVHMTLGQAVSGSARTAVVEWRDGDLVNKEYAPSRDFPPPAALFGGTLEDVLFVDGAYADASASTSSTNPGTALAPSEPGRPESFSPDTVIFTSDTPTALLKGDGLYWRFGRNSLHTVQYLGGDKPLSMEIVWEGTGIQFQNQACLGEGGRLYLWPANRGLLRMGTDGIPEGEWATAIIDDLIDCTDESKRVLGWDGRSHVVAVCYETTLWPYYSNLNRWGSPISLPFTVRSAVTENNLLLLTDTNDDIWEVGTGSGSTAIIRTPWKPGNAMDTVAMIMASIRADNTDNPITIEVFADGEETAVSSIDITPERTGYSRLPAFWPNVTDCESHAVQITITSTTATGDCGSETIASYGESTGAFR